MVAFFVFPNLNCCSSLSPLKRWIYLAGVERTNTEKVYYVRSATKVLNWFSFWCAKVIRGKTPNKTVLIKIFCLRTHNLIETPQCQPILYLYVDVQHAAPLALTHKLNAGESRLDSLSVTIRLCDAFQPKWQNRRNAFKLNAHKLDMPPRGHTNHLRKDIWNEIYSKRFCKKRNAVKTKAEGEGERERDSGKSVTPKI